MNTKQNLKLRLRAIYYWLINCSAYRQLIRLSKLFSRRGIYPFLDIQFSQIPTGSKVLNVGSGGQIGDLLKKYSAHNKFEIISLDISAERQPDIVGDICTYKFVADEYDAIVICEVLEHLHSPHKAIDNLHYCLKVGGKLIITVPFIFPLHDRPYDYYRYTRYGLEFLLRDFDAVSIKERNNWGEAINVLLVRHVMNLNVLSKVLAPFFILLAFMAFPFLFLAGSLIRADYITSGYLVEATKG